MIVIGYSGHAYVAIGILKASGKKVIGYCDVEEKKYNPFNLSYLGQETSTGAIQAFEQTNFFIAIGDNAIRKNIYEQLKIQNRFPINAIHPSAVIDTTATLATAGIMIAANATINSLATIGEGAICNTGCIIEHECAIGNFSHIGPGAVLCGNVKISDGAFVGAGAVIRQGIHIGKNSMIGAGAVVVKDVADNAKVVGVPAK